MEEDDGSSPYNGSKACAQVVLHLEFPIVAHLCHFTH